MKLDIGEVNIHTMLQSVVSLVHERLREHKIKFSLKCSRTIGNLFADETRIKQIIFNLLSNSIKYSEVGGKIVLSAEIIPADNGAQEMIAITIADDGMGIAPEEQQAVFDTFYRGITSRTQKSGAGLGLSMVKSFVELHGGRVELFSAAGEGTRVVCHLPRHNANLIAFMKAQA